MLLRRRTQMFNLKEAIKLIVRKKQQSMEKQPTQSISYKELRKQLKSEIIKLTEEAVKAQGYYLGSTAYCELRSKHIAYSMFKGKTFEQVEKSWKHPESWINLSVKKRAEILLASYQDRVKRHEEALCSCS